MKAFGNVQGHHVREEQYHDALRAHAILVVNPAHSMKVWSVPPDPATTYLERLREIAPESILLANINSLFVPNFGENSTYWTGYRAAMNDDSFYYLQPDGSRSMDPRWGGGFWPGFALRPELYVYEALAEWVSTALSGFDGIWVDDFHASMYPYRAAGLGLSHAEAAIATAKWRHARQYYLERIRARAPHLQLSANFAPADRARYEERDYELAAIGVEWPTVLDLSRWNARRSHLNIGWQSRMEIEGIVMPGYGLPFTDRNPEP